MKPKKLCAYCVTIWTLSVLSVLGILTLRILESNSIGFAEILNVGLLSGAGFVAILAKNPHAA